MRGGLARPSLDARAAELEDRLGREAEVADHGDAAVHDPSYERGDRAAPLQLHRLAAALLHQPRDVAERVLVADAIAHKGEVGDDERVLGAAADGRRVPNDVVESDGDGGVEAQYDHPKSIA